MRGVPTLARHLAPAVAAAAVLWFVLAALPAYRSYELATAGAYLVAVAGLTVLTGTSGQVSLGHGALVAIGAYTTALCVRALTPATPTGTRINFDAPTGGGGLPAVPPAGLVGGLVVAVLVTAAIGAVVGAAAARLHGPYLAGATLSLAVAVPRLAIHFGRQLGGDQGLGLRLPPAPSWLGGLTTERWQAVITLSAALLTLVLLANLLHSRTGRSMRAVRDDPVAAALAGIRVGRLKVLAFTVSAGCAGLAGGLFALLTQRVTPGAFELSLSLALLTAVVLGGLGRLSGAVLGALALVYLPAWTTDVTNSLALSPGVTERLHGNLPLALYGVLVIAVMLAAPGGLAGLLDRLRRLVPVPGGRRGGGPADPPAATPGAPDTPGATAPAAVLPDTAPPTLSAPDPGGTR